MADFDGVPLDADGETVPVEDVPAELTVEDIYPDDAPIDGDGTDADTVDGDESAEVDVDTDGTDDEGEGEKEPEAIPAPASWTKDDKAAWDAVPPEVKAVIARREAERDNRITAMGQEVAREKQSAQVQANEALAVEYERQAEVVRAVANYALPALPDDNLLNGTAEDRLEHYAQTQAYNARLGELRKVAAEAVKFDEKAEEIRTQNLRIEAAQGWRAIAQDNPDWFEPSTNDLKPDIQSLIETTGVELGFPVDLSVEFGEKDRLGFAEVSPQDIFAIKVAASWRDKAKRWDDYQKSKMAGVRAAKTLPKAAPSTGQAGPKQPTDWLKAMYPND